MFRAALSRDNSVTHVIFAPGVTPDSTNCIRTSGAISPIESIHAMHGYPSIISVIWTPSHYTMRRPLLWPVQALSHHHHITIRDPVGNKILDHLFVFLYTWIEQGSSSGGDDRGISSPGIPPCAARRPRLLLRRR